MKPPMQAAIFLLLAASSRASGSFRAAEIARRGFSKVGEGRFALACLILEIF